MRETLNISEHYVLQRSLAEWPLRMHVEGRTALLGAHRWGGGDCCCYVSAQKEAIGVTKVSWLLLNKNLSKAILCRFSLQTTSLNLRLHKEGQWSELLPRVALTMAHIVRWQGALWERVGMMGCPLLSRGFPHWVQMFSLYPYHSRFWKSTGFFFLFMETSIYFHFLILSLPGT